MFSRYEHLDFILALLGVCRMSRRNAHQVRISFTCNSSRHQVLHSLILLRMPVSVVLRGLLEKVFNLFL